MVQMYQTGNHYEFTTVVMVIENLTKAKYAKIKTCEIVTLEFFAFKHDVYLCYWIKSVVLQRDVALPSAM